MNDSKIPAFCPICARLMGGKRSIYTYYDFGCCVDCHIQWIEHREDRWKSGWRPDPETVEAFRAALKQTRL